MTRCPECSAQLLKDDRTFVGVCIECGADVDLHFVIHGDRGKLYAFLPVDRKVMSGELEQEET